MIEPLITRNPDKKGGIQKIYRFENGWGASVIKNIASYGYEEGLWELAVIRFIGPGENDWNLNYDHPESNGDCRGRLTDEEVEEILQILQKSEPYKP